ncbi:3'-5' exonuclease [Bifidobacterium amazonense]|uniref:3'-5' exonuclease n=1 Tax=Bifidobacterium amazonense TaxID=2809027 RepID=A0ABS9VYP6_9BIFI|nr:3'-5' exonuclease [Bifidobacterium amazonense]MCH9277240.1 3'-5' exonuclease [Bifidobacterium amazonense]
MSRIEYKQSRDKLHGTTTFNVGVKTVVAPEPPFDKRRFGVCSVESIPQPKGRKPHFAIRNSKGETVFEVGAQARNAYAVLEPLVGREIQSFSWEEKASIIDDGTYLSCKIVEKSQSTVADDPIPRIVLDTETTGLHPQYDEILQLSIIDGDGNVLTNNLYRPERHDSWPEAQRIHHISPLDVADKPSIQDDLQQIQAILDRAQEVCVYNADFDLAFLGELGLRLDKSKVMDTMREYGRRYHYTPYYKLENAAKECGYRYHAHDALADCQATLKVQQRLEGKAGTGGISKAIDAAKKIDDARKTVQTAYDSLPEETKAKVKGSVSKAAYITYAVLLWILVLLDIVVIAICFIAPYMLIVGIPSVLLTIWCFKQKKDMKSRVRAKHKK